MNYSFCKSFVLFGFMLGLMASSAFAIDIDCRNYTSETDPRCSYSIIEQTKGIQLFVVPLGERADDITKAIPNDDFYVYAPLSDNDSLDYILWSDGTKIKNRQIVTSGGESEPWVLVGVNGIYPIYNVPIGLSTKDDLSDMVVVRVYNFYAPDIEYCLDEKCNQIINSKDIDETKLEVGDTLTLYVRTVVSDGPNKGDVEKLTKSFYINPSGESENLLFLDMGNGKLPKQSLGYQLNIVDGFGKFKITTTHSITDGSTFTLDGYPDYTLKGDTTFIVSKEFPGGIRFDNHDMPSIDSAFVFDSDGDGIGDSITVYFGGNMQFIDVEKFEYDFPKNDKYTQFGGEEKHKDNVYFLSGAKMDSAENSTTGFIKANVVAINSGEKSIVGPSVLQDKMGPVIKNASVIMGDSKTDTLVVHFSKDIDESWTNGKGLVVNGNSIDVKAIEKNGEVWSFVVEKGLVYAGDSLQIALSCAKGACPDGLIKASDGNKTGVNKPCIVKNAGQLYVDNENNGFYDSDGDGRMDSATIAFDVPIQESDFENLGIKLYWLDSKSEVVEISLLNLDSLYKSGVVTLSSNGKILGIKVDTEKYDIQKMLTSIDKNNSKKGEEYGYAKVLNKVTINGKVEEKENKLTMNDRISPQILSTFLLPESFQKMESDELVLTFTEPIDFESIKDLSEAFVFSKNKNSWNQIELDNVEWSNDAKSVTIRMEVGKTLDKRINPADFISLNKEFKGFQDKAGNGIFENPMTVLLQGDPRVLAKTTALATKDYADLLSDKKDFTVRFVPRDSSLTDEMKMSLGVLMNIGFSTMMKEDSLGNEFPNLEEIGLTWEMYVYTNLGAYVAKASGDIYCNDSYFNPEGKQGKSEGNCLENPKKLYFRWNMRSENGRKVGIGVYLAKFKIKVFGAKNSFEYERYYNWGVKAGKNGLDLTTLGEK